MTDYWVVNGEMMGVYFFYVYFLFFCLFAGNGDYGLFFFTTFVLLSCLCWMHFLWCGVVCIEAFMEESQGAEDEDKEGVVK
jgi:hypothetical protein